jgi:hypothetical protein|tara:strand:- start:261 stop:509 length:249 start_codon:yes stop_codon:yes gene_type:complete
VAVPLLLVDLEDQAEVEVVQTRVEIKLEELQFLVKVIQVAQYVNLKHQLEVVVKVLLVELVAHPLLPQQELVEMVVMVQLVL